ncbi:MAG: hypothetical protein IH865_04455 [Chloroflexi bacterium]|nr:hypothetical protein [Chloroflexota bacterium]
MTLRTAVLAGIAVGLFVAACGGGGGGGGGVPEGTQVRATGGGEFSLDGVTVLIPPNALSEDTFVSLTTGDGPGQALEFGIVAGDAMRIDIGEAELLQPVSVQMTYEAAGIPDDYPEEAVFLAYFDEAIGSWVPVYGTVDTATRTVLVETDNLSWWQPWTWDLSMIIDEIGDNLESILAAGGLPSADIPDCGPPPVGMTFEFSETLLPCLEAGPEEGEATLKVANNRAYSVLATMPVGTELAEPVEGGSLFDAAWTYLVDKLSDRTSYIPPAAEAHFALEFAEAGTIRFNTRPSDVTLALDITIAMIALLHPQANYAFASAECVYQTLTAGGRSAPTVADLFEVARECVAFALAQLSLDNPSFQQVSIIWSAFQNALTIGAATGELLVDRTLGDGQGYVTVAYSPRVPGSTPQEGTAPKDPPGQTDESDRGASAATSIDAGSQHTCAVVGQGSVKCWGSNTSGQLGDGTTTQSTTPVELFGLDGGILAVAAGRAHTCALNEMGGVKCWGDNSRAQLGDGTTEGSNTPFDVNGLTNGVVAIASGDTHTCALTDRDDVWCWGEATHGQLGDHGESRERTQCETSSGPLSCRTIPTRVSGLGSVRAISAGGQHTCVVTAEGGVECWGNASQNRLGIGGLLSSAKPGDVIVRAPATLLTSIKSVTAGSDHTCALTLEDSIVCWGAWKMVADEGSGSAVRTSLAEDVPWSIDAVREISAGSRHTCFVTTSGVAKCWGGGAYGRLGDGTGITSPVPVDVVGITEGAFAITAGGIGRTQGHSCAITNAGRVKCWGNNNAGQLGDGTTTDRSTATDVIGLGR